jgi:hypothetical protein
MLSLRRAWNSRRNVVLMFKLWNMTRSYTSESTEDKRNKDEANASPEKFLDIIKDIRIINIICMKCCDARTDEKSLHITRDIRLMVDNHIELHFLFQFQTLNLIWKEREEAEKCLKASMTKNNTVVTLLRFSFLSSLLRGINHVGLERCSSCATKIQISIFLLSFGSL